MLVLALLGGTATAFALTQALKLRRSPITAPRFDRVFSPGCGCDHRRARLSLVLRKGDTLDAEIVDVDANAVRTLAENRRRPKGRAGFVWNGRDESGAVVPDGPYRLRIHLDDARRTILLPNEVEVDTKPPRGRVLRVSRRILSPDGDRRNDRVRVRYRSSERAQAVLRANGVPVARTKFRRSGAGVVLWSGRIGERPARAGLFGLSLQLLDEAGNVSEPSQPVGVRVRYLELLGGRLRVPREGRLAFSVATDVAVYRWVLLRRTVFGPPGAAVLRGVGRARQTLALLPRRIKPGRYVLRVSARGHMDSVSVRVSRRT